VNGDAASLRAAMKTRYGSVATTRRQDEGCSINLDGLGHRVVLRGEGLSLLVAPQRRSSAEEAPDCLVIGTHAGGPILGVVELKSKTASASNVQQKLVNGIHDANEALAACGRTPNLSRTYPIVLAKSRRASAFQVLASRELRVGATRLRVTVGACGDRLTDIVDKVDRRPRQ